MTDASPLLPSQVTDTFKEEKPLPLYRKILRFILQMYFLYIAPLTCIIMFIPFFQGAPCSVGSIRTDALIIGIIIFVPGFLTASLTFWHNCKIGKSLNPEKLDGPTLKKTGELYKGHKALVHLTTILGLMQLAVGIYAFVFALQNQSSKDIEDCGTYLTLALIVGIIVMITLGLTLRPC